LYLGSTPTGCAIGWTRFEQSSRKSSRKGHSSGVCATGFLEYGRPGAT
jgi:hypothetical protein